MKIKNLIKATSIGLVLAGLAITVLPAFGEEPQVIPEVKQEGVVTVNETVHDFGIMKADTVKEIKTTFIITNNTDKAITITASPSCGCTASEYTREPIEPGKTGFVTAQLKQPKDYFGKAFDKSVTINTNSTPATIIVRFKGSISQN
ncbi:MAG: DUF1573 domain-containing protein [Candidatus Symbiothrix sp.]|jgi:hypothetical protein|nr:DUF1573 domain-containing protein [Candidatus Symbiothrix sp.]